MVILIWVKNVFFLDWPRNLVLIILKVLRGGGGGNELIINFKNCKTNDDSK